MFYFVSGYGMLDELDDLPKDASVVDNKKDDNNIYKDSVRRFESSLFVILCDIF